jgi:hypothetical protein
MRVGLENPPVALHHDVSYVVAPRSAIGVYALDLDHQGVPIAWCFLGRIHREIAEILGPLVDQGLVRLTTTLL